MTPEEVLAAIRAKGLRDCRWFEDATNDTDIVAIQRTESPAGERVILPPRGLSTQERA